MEAIIMASFKINIADPKTGKCYKTEVKDALAEPFMGLNIGEKIEGSKLGIEGSEFSISGGTDYCGFPMRKGILETVCGHKINEQIAAINLKVLKEGTKKISDMFGKKEEGKEEVKEEKKPEAKPKEEPKKEAKPKQDKPEEKK
jgi:small subunit ribosomal protein S6e